MTRKYLNFILVFEDGQFYESSDWRGVFADYMRNRSATIYGLPNYEGANYTHLMSK